MIDVENYNRLKKEAGTAVKIIAVSKTRTVEEIRFLHDLGHRHFGENRALELRDKQSVLPQDIQWHYIGHLQTNKIKYFIKFVHLIHSVDSFNLLKEINKESQKNQRVVDCLMQVHIAQEETKFGFDEQELRSMMESDEFPLLQHVRLRGMMGMATFTEDETQVTKEFRYLRKLFEEVSKNYFAGKENFSELSMGMSDDYKIAIKEGSTMIRVGTLIFGKRN